MLEVRGLSVAIGAVGILQDIDLEVPSGGIRGLIGHNGAGKTTLLRAVMGLLPARAGSIRFDGEDLLTLPGHRRAHLGIGYMPEDRRLVPQLSAEDNILLPVWSVGIPEHESRLAWIYELMPEVADFRARAATQLSGGQQKMVALARALMAGNRLLLLDEPTEGIAPVLARRMIEILIGLKETGLPVLVSESNDAHLSGGLLDHVYVIERGEVRT